MLKTEPMRGPSAPPVFVDSNSNSWQIKLTLDLADKILAATQFDPLPPDSDPSELIALHMDDRRLGNVLWCCCQAQAEIASMDRSTFKAGLDGPALSRGWEALANAILFFIQAKSPKLADHVEQMMNKQMAFIEKAAAEVVKTLNDPRTDAALAGVIEEAQEQMQKEIDEAFAKKKNGQRANSVTKSPASPE